jgi:putative tricarboxylic transport membrane protein
MARSISTTPRTDLALSAALIAFSIAIWVESYDIPPPFFDPLGSAVVPRIVASVIALLSLAVGLRALRTLNSAAAAVAGTAGLRPDIAAGTAGLTVFYLLFLGLGWLGFMEATIAYVLVSGVLLGARDRRSLIVLAGLALLLGVGGMLLFTRVFYIDLPT